MTYSRPSLARFIAATLLRRSKSEGHLHLRGTEEQSSPSPENTRQRPATADQVVCSAVPWPPPTKQCSLSDAHEQWDALVGREGQCAYDIIPPSYFQSQDDKRSKICTWCYTFADSMGIDRRVVIIALSFFDRYTTANNHSSELQRSADWWLLVMACLGLAIKLHSNKNEACHKNDSYMEQVLLVLRYTCSVPMHQVAKMELRVCEALQWYLNPPVPVMYLEVALPFIDEIISNNDQMKNHELTELVRFLTEICVYDTQLCGEKPSSVAYAAILVAMNHLHIPTRVVNKWLSLTLKHSSRITDGCIPKLQQHLAANLDSITSRCSSPTNV